MVMSPPRRLDHRTADDLARMDGTVLHLEETEAWKRARRAVNRGHLALIAGRIDITEQSFGELHAVVSRRLRQLGGDAA